MPRIKTNAIVAQNAASDWIKLPSDMAAAVWAKSDSANPAGAVFVLQADMEDGDPISIGMLKPADGTALVNLTGPSVAGCVPLNLKGASRIRVKRTDATGGNAYVYLGITCDC